MEFYTLWIMTAKSEQSISSSILYIKWKNIYKTHKKNIKSDFKFKSFVQKINVIINFKFLQSH